MEIVDLFEDAASDLGTVRLAQSLSNQFARWLTKANETTPLKDIPEGQLQGRERGGRFMKMITFAAKDMGINNRHNLRFGVGWYEDGVEHGEMGLMISSGTMVMPFYTIVLVSQKDCSNDVDVAFGLHWSSCVHELIHYLDWKRGYINTVAKRAGKPRQALDTPERYYNDPLEFNAHFQQGLAQLMNSASFSLRYKPEKVSDYLVSFDRFSAWSIGMMPKDFVKQLNPEYKKKFGRRLYKLYDLFRSKWPDIEAIKLLADEYASQ